jgi:hypothetical protein
MSKPIVLDALVWLLSDASQSEHESATGSDSHATQEEAKPFVRPPVNGTCHVAFEAGDHSHTLALLAFGCALLLGTFVSTSPLRKLPFPYTVQIIVYAFLLGE